MSSRLLMVGSGIVGAGLIGCDRGGKSESAGGVADRERAGSKATADAEGVPTPRPTLPQVPPRAPPETLSKGNSLSRPEAAEAADRSRAAVSDFEAQVSKPPDGRSEGGEPGGRARTRELIGDAEADRMAEEFATLVDETNHSQREGPDPARLDSARAVAARLWDESRARLKDLTPDQRAKFQEQLTALRRRFNVSVGTLRPENEPTRNPASPPAPPDPNPQ